ncbi:MAG: NADH-quinone oxidoreductase subunit J [Cytophagaceae bacterium]|nr:NADH-quinone oxidoreductase subunit J [Cytophagaceae bacterium]
MNYQEILSHLDDAVFYIFCAIAVGGAIYVLLAKNVLYAAYGLLCSFLGVAGIFVFAGSEYVAVSQIMIYVGGILILLVFGIMLSSNKKSGKEYLRIKNRNLTWGLSVGLALIALMTIIVSSLKIETSKTPTIQSIKYIGFSLMTEHVLALELIGILLLVALVGATFIAKTDE